MTKNQIIAISFIVLIIMIPLPLPFVFSQAVDQLESKDYITYFASVFIAICTAGLGLLAYWQNGVIREQAEKEKDELLRLNEQAHNINERLLRIEEEKQTPFINFYDYRGGEEDCLEMDFYVCKVGEGEPLNFLVRDITSIDIESIVLCKLHVVDILYDKA